MHVAQHHDQPAEQSLISWYWLFQWNFSTGQGRHQSEVRKFVTSAGFAFCWPSREQCLLHHWHRLYLGNMFTKDCQGLAALGIKPGSSHTLRENHATRPSNQCTLLTSNAKHVWDVMAGNLLVLLQLPLLKLNKRRPPASLTKYKDGEFLAWQPFSVLMDEASFWQR